MSTTTTATEITGGAGPSGGAPDDAKYLVTTAHSGLSDEVVVGTSPGGELGGTWASPTVDATHSGSAHHANTNDPSSGEKAALAGTSGTPGSGNKYVTDGDSRMTDSRAPSGSAGGDLSGTYPNPSVSDDSHGHTATTVTTHSTAHAHSALTGIGADDHHARSHDHSNASDGSALSPATLVLPARTSSYPTATGDAIYHSSLGALIVGSGGGQSFILPVTGSSPTTQAFGDAAVVGTADSVPHSDHKHAMPTLGYGLSGNSAPAVGLTASVAHSATETSISAATYADVNDLAISLAAGTWFLVADVYGRIVNARAQMNVAITDSSNNVVGEGSADIPASGAANVNATQHCGVHAVVSPGSTTTYKVRAARGNTSNTGTWTAMDGAATGVSNNASDNTDKGSRLIAIRLA